MTFTAIENNVYSVRKSPLIWIMVGRTLNLIVALQTLGKRNYLGLTTENFQTHTNIYMYNIYRPHNYIEIVMTILRFGLYDNAITFFHSCLHLDGSSVLHLSR